MRDSNVLSPIITEASSEAAAAAASSTTSSKATEADEADVNSTRKKRKVNRAFRPILKLTETSAPQSSAAAEATAAAVRRRRHPFISLLHLLLLLLLPAFEIGACRATAASPLHPARAVYSPPPPQSGRQSRLSPLCLGENAGLNMASCSAP